jgi:hypothetical protein
MAEDKASRTRELLYALATGYFTLSAMIEVEAGRWLRALADVAGAGVFILLVLTERRWPTGRPGWVSPVMLGLAAVAIALLVVNATQT